MELPKKGEWTWVHDILRGFGFRRWEEDGINGAGDKVLWHRDVLRLTGIDIWKDREQDFDALYERVSPIVEAEREERRKNYVPKPITHINVPKVNRIYPEL